MGRLESGHYITVFSLDSFEVIDLKLMILQFGNFALQFFLICHGLLWIVL